MLALIRSRATHEFVVLFRTETASRPTDIFQYQRWANAAPEPRVTAAQPRPAPDGVVLRYSHRSGARMETVTISTKFQVVIPRRIREALDLKAGQKVRVVQYDNRVEFVPILPIKRSRGFLRGIDSNIEREPDRS
jgi:AbrB family looped-hinge helix DNA binding protein